jgi:hypothetical protein
MYNKGKLLGTFGLQQPAGEKSFEARMYQHANPDRRPLEHPCSGNTVCEWDTQEMCVRTSLSLSVHAIDGLYAQQTG